MIERVIQKFTVQDAIYWASPQPDGFGGFTYGDPQEIKVRWEDKTQVVIGADGKEVTSGAELLVNLDLDLESRVMLGSLDDVGSDDTPEGLGAREIVRFEKIPMVMQTNDFVRKAYVR